MLQELPAVVLEKSLTKGLYIHIPFCQKKCNYCDFYSLAITDFDRKLYIDSLSREIKKWGTRIACPIDTIYFGGGTPSLLSKQELGQIMSSIRESFIISENAEITAEVNPDDRDFLSFASLVGINRISIGIQSSNTDELKMLGRRHSFADAEYTVKLARELGFSNISADIMFGLPNSSISTLNQTVQDIISLNIEHISAYILKVEDNTPFGKMGITLPDDDFVAEQFLFVSERLKNAGYLHYEISNFAKEGKMSRHNNKYWECKEYIGIGPSAHSFIDGKRYYYKNDIKEFIKETEPIFDSNGGDEEEYIMLALRLSKGLNINEFHKLFNKQIPLNFIEKAKKLSEIGLVNITQTCISLTEQGMLVSNNIITELTKELI